MSLSPNPHTTAGVQAGEYWARIRDARNRFAALISNVPFMAIIEGRNSLKIAELGWWGVILALVLYGLFLYFHKTLFRCLAVAWVVINERAIGSYSNLGRADKAHGIELG